MTTWTDTTTVIRGTSAPLGAPIRASLAGAEPQKISEVVKLARGDPDAIPLLFGESDLVTPDFISRVAIKALAAGQTFYTHKRGLPELREALSDYVSDLYGRTVGVERVSVTTGGMNGIMLSMQLVLSAGTNVVMVTPAWPNTMAAVTIVGAELRPVTLEAQEGRVWLDLDKLFGAVDEHTRMIVINSPSNPTAWMMTREEQQEVLDFCRRRHVWLLADEVYARLVYGRRAAPSFLEIAEPDDPILVVNSFSKTWAMTGWRLGWLVTPPAVGDILEDTIDYNVSGVPTFLQPAGVAAVREGELFVAEMVEYCRRGRDVVVERLSQMQRIRFTPPTATFYAFFQVESVSDSVSFAKRLLEQTGVGVAPGAAFGPGGEGWFRLCFARTPETLERAMDRLQRTLR